MDGAATPTSEQHRGFLFDRRDGGMNHALAAGFRMDEKEKFPQERIHLI